MVMFEDIIYVLSIICYLDCMCMVHLPVRSSLMMQLQLIDHSLRVE